MSLDASYHKEHEYTYMVMGWGSEQFLSYTGGGEGIKIFWWREYSADDNTEDWAA